MAIIQVYESNGALGGAIETSSGRAVLRRHVITSRDLLRVPPGWALDKHILERLYEVSAECGFDSDSAVVVLEDDKSGIWTAHANQFFQVDFRISRGFEIKYVLPPKEWDYSGRNASQSKML